MTFADVPRDDQWERLRDLVSGGRAGQRGPRCGNRLFVDTLLWMARSGGRWRDLPERYGSYASVKRRYYRWIEMDVLGGMLAVLGLVDIYLSHRIVAATMTTAR